MGNTEENPKFPPPSLGLVFPIGSHITFSLGPLAPWHQDPILMRQISLSSFHIRGRVSLVVADIPGYRRLGGPDAGVGVVARGEPVHNTQRSGLSPPESGVVVWDVGLLSQRLRSGLVISSV